ncbi:BNR-4 repeat-containing protein [Verrucomicrobiaceae bacterium N1E253]|uniref:BNR-4 repeat-containing protein n=1 Tax=Oceaniferula marina TaxID=2748318 RepID=A0A851GK96_9BACT|nr:BNR-4 repeat-containing protein [Oceaniferula marina]NWK55595.1 BNR-4 repeat-containing protein [Oceaniferula marina]
MKTTTLFFSLFGLLPITGNAQTYVDANSSNTQAIDGTPNPWSTTATTSDALWRFRAGFGFDVAGNNGIYEKDGASGGYGDAAMLVTTITGLTPNTEYAVYVNFLSASNANWQLQAGLTSDSLNLFTPSSNGVENLGLSSVSGSNRNQLRGFITNTHANAAGEIQIYIDDTNATTTSNRSWFDGVSYGTPVTVPEPEAGLITSDGVWTWFNDERAIWHQDKLYVGHVKRNGKVAVTRHDPATGTNSEAELSSVTERDDHNNPALHALPNGNLIASYSRHSTDKHYFYRISDINSPLKLSDWGTEQTHGTDYKHSYANTYAMSEESNTLYTFTRGTGWNPNWTSSSDNGTNWTPLKVLIQNGDGSTRPYVRYSGNNTNAIDFIYTDGHPRDENNSIYHARIHGGQIRHTDGTVIKALSDSPIIHDIPSGQHGTIVYQYSADAQTDPNQWIPGGRAWTWDIQQQKNNDPVITFTVQKDNVTGSGWQHDRIYYYYARWTGTEWQKRFIAHAGRPLYEREDDYAGGICIDPERPNVVYISSNAASPFDLSSTTNVPLNADSRYELWKGTTTDGGLSFSWESVTQNSSEDNIRPFVPKNHQRSESLLWLKGIYSTYTNYNTRILSKIGDKQTSYLDWKTQNNISGSPDDDDNHSGLSNLLEYYIHTSKHQEPHQLLTTSNRDVILPSHPESHSLISILETSTNLIDWTEVAASIYGSPYTLISSQSSNFQLDKNSKTLTLIDQNDSTKRFYHLNIQLLE